MEYSVMCLDVEFAHIYTHETRYELGYFLQDPPAVDAFNPHMGCEHVGDSRPLSCHNTRALASLEHLGSRTVDSVNLHFAVIVDKAEHIVAGYGIAT